VTFPVEDLALNFVKMKKRSERREHCALAVVRRSQRFSPRRDGQNLISCGHYLYLQTQFGEDRCMQFRVIVITDPQTHTHTQTNKPTDRTDYKTLRRYA